MRLDPISLKLFISVLEEGTIAAAAEREHIAAAAVSKRMSEIESILGTQLLIRTNKGITATAAGVALTSMARRVLQELDDISVQMQEYASGVRGHVRVFANISAITQFLPQELGTFLEKYPQIQVHLEERISSNIIKSVAENSADIGIYTSETNSYNLELLPYHKDELAIITPLNHALTKQTNITFAQTLAYDFVGLHTGSAINHLLMKEANNLKLSPKIRIQVTSYDALCLMVNARLGIALLPHSVALQHAKSLDINVIRLKEPWIFRELAICVRSYNALPIAAKLLVDHLTARSTASI